MYLSCIAIITYSGNNVEQISKAKQQGTDFLAPCSFCHQLYLSRVDRVN